MSCSRRPRLESTTYRTTTTPKTLRPVTTSGVHRAGTVRGAIYRAELASALQRLGYRVEVTHSDGRFEVKGFSQGQLRHFSRRRKEIEAALKELGASGAKASATLALYTRARKGPIDRNELNRDWKVRADAQGLRFERPQPEKAPKAHRQLVKLARDAVDWAIAHLTERESVVNHRDVVRHSLEYGTGHLTLSSDRELKEVDPADTAAFASARFLPFLQLHVLQGQLAGHWAVW